VWLLFAYAPMGQWVLVATWWLLLFFFDLEISLEISPNRNMAHQHQQHVDCADCCASCHTTCVRTLAHCLKQGGAHVEPAHLQLLQDCIAVCQVCSDMCARGSCGTDLCAKMCALCSEACARCAQSCDKINDAQMKACAEACRRCAEDCATCCKKK
jgi:hypothetical protein